MWLPATKTEVGSRGITAAGGDPDLLRLLFSMPGSPALHDTRKRSGRRSISVMLRLDQQTLNDKATNLSSDQLVAFGTLLLAAFTAASILVAVVLDSARVQCASISRIYEALRGDHEYVSSGRKESTARRLFGPLSCSAKGNHPICLGENRRQTRSFAEWGRRLSEWLW